MSWVFRESLEISLTDSQTFAKYYRSATNDLRVPYGCTPTEALTWVKIKGSIDLVDNSYGGYDTYETYRFNFLLDSQWHKDLDNYGLQIKCTPILESGSWGSRMKYNVLIELDTSGIAAIHGSYVVDFTKTVYGATAYEQTPVSITTTDTYKNLEYGDTVSLGGTLSVTYSVGGTITLSGNDLSSFLIAHETTVSMVNNEGITSTLTYPNNFQMTGNKLQNKKIQIVYTLNNGASFSQYVGVTYYDDLVLGYSTAETGTADSPVYSDADGITIGTTGFSAVITKYTNTLSSAGVLTSTETEINVTSYVSWSRISFTAEEILSLNGNPYNISILYLDEFARYNGAYLTVFLDIKRPVSATINGADTDLNYYQNEDSYFVEPNFTQDPEADELITFLYTDGSTKDIDPDDIDTIEYFLSNDGTGTALVDGTSIIPAAYTQLYAKITLTNGEVAYAPYNIYRTADTVDSITCSPSFVFVLGNKLDKYKGNQIQVTAHWTNPAKADTSNFTDFTFDYTAIVMSGSDLGASTNIHIGSAQFTISLSGVTFSNPDVDYVSVVQNRGIRNAYQNVLEAIDLTDVKLLVHYEDAEYTKQLTFSSTNTASNSEFGVKIYDNVNSQQILNNVNYINGTTHLDLSDSVAKYDCKFQFQIKNEFTTTTATELEIVFYIMTLQKLTGIRIIDAYRDYKVGEEFLKDEDTTIARLFYDVEENGVTTTASTDVYLKEDIPTINVNYAKGTEWTQPDSSKRIVVNSVFDSSISAEYTIQVTYDGFVSGSKTNDLVVVWKPYVILPDGSRYGGADEPNGVLVLFDEEDTQVVDGVRSLKPEIESMYNADITTHTRGYIKNIFNTKMLDSQATLVLFKDYTPPIEGASNITINFPCYTGLADNINKCQFGILFGNNNANNRLFVSGNPEIRNADWHSGETNTIHTEGESQSINGDFSYFPNENVMYYGETDNKVIGYDIVSNDKLLVLKDKSDKEKTVYFRTPTLVTALDATGTAYKDVQGNALYQEEFALVKGNNSVAGINPHAIANLNGDTLFIDSDNTVEGLDLTGIVGDNQRYANSRSLYLDNLLKKLDLSKSFLWTNNKYLFMPVKDVGLFVTHINAASSESKQYDWWKLQSENPTCFVEIDNVVYFGNEDGDLYQMRNGKFEDEYKVFVNEGQGVLAKINEESTTKVIDGIEIPSESVVVSQDIYNQLFPLDSDGNETNPYYVDGKQVRHLFFHSVNTYSTYIGAMFYQIGTISNDATLPNVDLLIKDYDGTKYLEVVAKVNGTTNIERQQQLIQLLKENKEYYLNYYKEEGVQEVKCNPTSRFYNNYNNRFRLVFVPTTENDRYLLEIFNTTSQQWENIDLADLYKACLVSKLDGDYELYDVDRTTYSFRLRDEAGNPMNIVSYGTQGVANTFSAEIIERKNVVAYYVTAPFTMGNINYFKTIWSFTFTNDTGEASEYDLAIASNKVPTVDAKTVASISKAKIGTNFSDFTFNAVDFDKDVVPRTYTIQRTLGMQKFVCFAFKNDNNSDAILSSLSVIYTLPFPSYGND